MRSPNQLKDAAKMRLKTWCIDFGSDDNTVFLAGTGRSGTTWLEEVIDNSHEHRVLFEPFHSKEVPQLAHWRYRQYLRPSDGDPRYLLPASRILRGQLHNRWVDQFNRKHLARRRLIKDIRANLLLRWIHEQFPRIRIVLVMRHPCAVAASKMALGWQTHLDDFLAQPQLLEDFVAPFASILESTHDPFERHILLWCIENWIPLQQFAPGQIHVCFYEHFCLEPEREARALLDFLDRPFTGSLLEHMRKPSALCREESAIRIGGSLIDSWRNYVSDHRIKRTVELLRVFDLDRIYDQASLPKIDRRLALDMFKVPNVFTDRPNHSLVPQSSIAATLKSV